MTDFLTEKFKELPEVDLPAGFHDRVMTSVVSNRFRHAFATILSLLFVNLLVVSIFLVIRMIHNDAFAFIKFMANEFELSKGYFSQFGAVLYQNIPLGLFLTVVLNLILIRYIWKFQFLFKNAGRAFLKTN
jgi:hypothetical protein